MIKSCAIPLMLVYLFLFPSNLKAQETVKEESLWTHPLDTPLHVLSIKPKIRIPEADEKIQSLSSESNLGLSATSDIPQTINWSPQSNSTVFKPAYWHSDHFYHKRLIFDEPEVENQGQCSNRQNAISGAKFFTRGILFPLQFVTRKPQRHCEMDLGWQSGSIAPQLKQPILTPLTEIDDVSNVSNGTVPQR